MSEAGVRLSGHATDLPQLAVTIEESDSKIDQRREQQQRVEGFEQLARDAMDDMCYHKGIEGDTALRALEMYGVLSDDQWIGRLQDSYLSEEQKTAVRQTAYETLLVLADFQHSLETG